MGWYPHAEMDVGQYQRDSRLGGVDIHMQAMLNGFWWCKTPPCYKGILFKGCNARMEWASWILGYSKTWGVTTYPLMEYWACPTRLSKVHKKSKVHGFSCEKSLKSDEFLTKLYKNAKRRKWSTNVCTKWSRNKKKWTLGLPISFSQGLFLELCCGIARWVVLVVMLWWPHICGGHFKHFMETLNKHSCDLELMLRGVERDFAGQVMLKVLPEELTNNGLDLQRALWDI